MSGLPASIIYLTVGSRRWPVASAEDASRKFLAVVACAGTGASRTPTPLIIGSDGRLIGHISYNGRVWAGDPRAWDEQTAMLYDSRAPGASLDQISAARAAR